MKGLHLGSTLPKSLQISSSTLVYDSIPKLSESTHDRFDPEEHIVIHIQLLFNNTKVKTHAMIDSGATSCFIDIGFAKKHNIALTPKEIPHALEVIDGRPVISGPVTHETPSIQLQIDQHLEKITFDATQLGHYPVVLGISWLKRHDPSIVWSRDQLTFNSKFCSQNCLQSSVSHVFSERPVLSSLQTADRLAAESCDVASASSTSARSPDAAQPHPTSEEQYNLGSQSVSTPRISRVNFAALRRAAKKGQLYTLELRPSDYQPNHRISATLSANQPTQVTQLVPSEYHDLLDAFSKKKADALPSHRPYDHVIPLVPGETPPFGPIYSLSEVELKALSDYLKENLDKGFIRPSSSPAGAPILFVKKKDGSLRLCVDYRALNKITVKNRYPLPLISEMLDRLRSARYFTKIDLRGAYNLVRIAEGEEWKTAFRCRYGHFEYTVMPFGLTNAPATFQHFMNDTFRDLLDQSVVVYLDDILIYSADEKEHQKHVRLVLERLLSARLYAKAEKCEFHRSEIEFLGYVVSPSGIKMDPKKVSAITSWPVPQSVHDIQVFLGFANFYRRFVKGYSKITLPLTALLAKDSKFTWSPSAQQAFETLKSAFTTAPVLAHFDPSRQSVVETDASDFAIGCILSQYSDDGTLHPVAFYSRKFTPAEINYEIYDKEMLAIVTAFREWRQYLEGSQHQIKMFTDHKNLEWFTTTKNLTRRQASSPLPSTAASSHPQRSTTRFTTKKCWQSSQPSANGVNISKVRNTRSRCSQITKTSNGSLPPRISLVVKLVGQSSSLGTTLLSSTVQAHKVANQMLSPVARTTALKRGMRSAFSNKDRFSNPVNSFHRQLSWLRSDNLRFMPITDTTQSSHSKWWIVQLFPLPKIGYNKSNVCTKILL